MFRDWYRCQQFVPNSIPHTTHEVTSSNIHQMDVNEVRAVGDQSESSGTRDTDNQKKNVQDTRHTNKLDTKVTKT